MFLVEQIESSRKSMDLKFIFVESVATETERMPFIKIKRLIWQSRQQGKRYLNLNVGPMMIS